MKEVLDFNIQVKPRFDTHGKLAIAPHLNGRPIYTEGKCLYGLVELMFVSIKEGSEQRKRDHVKAIKKAAEELAAVCAVQLAALGPEVRPADDNEIPF